MPRLCNGSAKRLGNRSATVLVRDALDCRMEFDALVRRTRGLQPWRRVFHAAGGVAMAGFAGVAGPNSSPVRWTFAALALAAATLDVVRLIHPAANTAFFRRLSALASPREARRIASSTWYLASALVLSLLAPAPVFVPSLLVLAVADPAAGVAGRLWGKRPVGTGTWEGAGVFFLAAAAVLAPFVGLVAFPVAAAVAILEVSPTGLDDNLVVPLATAFALAVVGLGAAA